MQIEPVLRALADPTRLRLMRLIAAMELAVGELAHVLGQSQPRVSRHVAILAEAGLVERRKEGSWVFLRASLSGRDAEALPRAVARMLAAAEEADPVFAAAVGEDRRHLAEVREARERAAADYFARHAEVWDRERAMLAAPERIEEALLGALDDDLGAVLDIGTGTGRIAELLLARADHVTGLDKSPEMLRLARARLQDRQGVALVQGDFAALPFAPASFDTVVFHQVLHFAQEPAAALAEAARVLRPGGRLAIVDLAAHDREALRREHAHARLGFEEAQMERMLEKHCFAPKPVRVLEGGELPVCIWLAKRQDEEVPTILPHRGRGTARGVVEGHRANGS